MPNLDAEVKELVKTMLDIAKDAKCDLAQRVKAGQVANNILACNLQVEAINNHTEADKDNLDKIQKQMNKLSPKKQPWEDDDEE